MKRFIFLFFLFLLFTGIIFANQIKYELTTTNTNSSPYYIGTTISNLKISFVDNQNKILDINKAKLDIKLGQEKFTLNKANDSTYNLSNIIILPNLLTDSKFVILITTLLPKEYTNTKQTYTLGNINDIIKVKNNPLTEYSNATVGEYLNIKLLFEDLENQQINNLDCRLDSFDSEEPLTCTDNECNIDTPIKKNNIELGIYCLFDKTVNKVNKKYPLVYVIPLTQTLGVKVNEITNPKDGKIANPFELCFTANYESGRQILYLDTFKLFIDNEEKELYKRDNDFCFKQFLIPFTTLNKNFVFNFNDQNYISQVNLSLSPGPYWTGFIVIVVIIILINVILIIRALASKESLEDLVKERDSYKNRLVVVKEQYLQGELNKKEFESKLNEYSVKISWLNEKIMQMKPSGSKTTPTTSIQEKEIDELNNIESKKETKKAPKELLNALFSEPNKEKVKAKDEDLILEETQINDTSELVKEFNSGAYEKKEGFFARLFKRKSKPISSESKDDKKETKEESKPIEEKPKFEAKDPFKDNSLEDEFDIRKWQK